MRTYEMLQKEYNKDVAKPALDTPRPILYIPHEGASYHQGASRGVSPHLCYPPVYPPIHQSIRP